MMNLICGLLWSEYATSIISLAAFLLSLFTLIGCDYVRLNFASVNEANRYFVEPSWFGLGFINHQNFDENKSSYKWDHNATCYNYDELSKEMFGESSLSSALTLATWSTILSFIVLICTLATTFCFRKQKCLMIRVLAWVLSCISAILQIMAYLAAFKDDEGGVCDPSSYGDSWEYTNVTYIKFFSECTVGSTATLGLASVVCQLFSYVWMVMNFNVKNKEEMVEDFTEKKIQKKDVPDRSRGVSKVDQNVQEQTDISFPLKGFLNDNEEVDIEEGESPALVQVAESEITEVAVEEVSEPEDIVDETVPLTQVVEEDAVKEESNVEEAELEEGSKEEDNLQEVSNVGSNEEAEDLIKSLAFIQ